VTGESQKTVEEAPEAGEVRAYNMSSQERIVRGACRRWRSSTSASPAICVSAFSTSSVAARRSPSASAGPAVQRIFARVGRPHQFQYCGDPSLRGQGLIVCEPALVFGVIDTLYGGIGKFQTRIEGRDFSATEQRIINRLVEVIKQEYKTAWKGIYPIELEHQRSEMQPQFANIATPAKLLFQRPFSWKLARSRVPSISACLTQRWSRFVTYFIHLPGGFDRGGSALGDCVDREIQAAEVTLVAELAERMPR